MDILIQFVFLVIFFVASLPGLNNHNRYEKIKKEKRYAHTNRYVRSNGYRNYVPWREVIRHIQPITQGENNSSWPTN